MRGAVPPWARPCGEADAAECRRRRPWEAARRVASVATPLPLCSGPKAAEGPRVCSLPARTTIGYGGLLFPAPAPPPPPQVPIVCAAWPVHQPTTLRLPQSARGRGGPTRNTPALCRRASCKGIRTRSLGFGTGGPRFLLLNAAHIRRVAGPRVVPHCRLQPFDAQWLMHAFRPQGCRSKPH
jgi:hypothetical protein